MNFISMNEPLLNGIEKKYLNKNLKLPLNGTGYAENLYWMYGVVLDDKIGFEVVEAIAQLVQKGIGTRPFFWHMHVQPVFNKLGQFSGEQYPVAQRITRRGFYLPSGLGLTDEQQDRIAVAVRAVSKSAG